MEIHFQTTDHVVAEEKVAEQVVQNNILEQNTLNAIVSEL